MLKHEFIHGWARMGACVGKDTDRHKFTRMGVWWFRDYKSITAQNNLSPMSPMS